MDAASPLFVACVAIGLGVAAQGFINQMLEGDQGLGAFLKDGRGYKKSGFRQLSSSKKGQTDDPLPWLKLPQLDFVEVAGQPNRQVDEDALMERLERLRLQMNGELEQGNIKKAASIREELEELMKESGTEYNAGR